MAHRLTRAAAALFSALLLSTAASASYVDVTVSTEKTTYSPGEALRFLVTARNTTDREITLGFGSTIQAQYAIDGGIFYPTRGATVLTHNTLPANGAYTWTFRHRWSGESLEYGVHSFVGRLYGWGGRPHHAAGPITFEVVPPTLPTDDFLLNFDALPGRNTPMTSIEETWPSGVRFRSQTARGDYPGIYTSDDKSNSYVGVMLTTYPPGFNIIADLDVRAHGATVNVSSAAGVAVTMIARGRDGQLLASVTSDPVPAYGDFTESLSIQSADDIFSLEWWPSQENASVLIDNLAIALPEPTLSTLALASPLLLARRRPRPAVR